MVKLVRNIEKKVNDGAIALKTRMMVKTPGDGHYVAIAICLLISLAIGGIIWAVAGGDSGMVKTWINSVTSKVTSFMDKITSANL